MTFRSRQAGLLALVIVFLLVAFSGSDLFGAAILQLWYGPPTYINPVILLALILFGGLGLLTMFRSNDRGYPWLLGLMGLWMFIVAFEDSILQWFTFQFGAQFTGGRIDPLMITAAAAAFGTAALMHANMLARRLRDGFVERGIEPEELTEVLDRSHAEARRVVLRLVGIVALASVILWVAQFALLELRLGLGVLGILGGLIIVSAISALAFRVLRKGPVPEMAVEARGRGSGARPVRRPPGGLR